MVKLLLHGVIIFHSMTFLCLEALYHGGPALPADHQLALRLSPHHPQRLVYTSFSETGALSATLIACEATVRWSLVAPNTNQSVQITSSGMDTHHLRTGVVVGEYFLDMEALERETMVQIYISSEIGGPQTLQHRNNSNLRVLRRQRKSVSVKWAPSLVDPQCTDYCLIVGTQRHYPSLCSAQAAGPSQQPTIVCVGRKTQYTLANMSPGKRYYFNLFATNNQSAFTYPYGSVSMVYDSKFRPLRLRDGKATFANLKKLDGKAVFRYKVGRKTKRNLELFIMPCGGVIDVEVMLKEKVLVPALRIVGFKKMMIRNPVVGGRYYIKVFATNGEDVRKTTGVEIYATTKPTRIPLPNMPQELKITDYSSLTTCRSVTVGWIVAPGQKTVSYCVIVKEGVIPETYRMPNQCGLENRLRKSADYVVKFCKESQFDHEEAVVEKIKQLEPATSYIVQVVVKKPKGKTLSYDLLQVRTKASCKQ